MKLNPFLAQASTSPTISLVKKLFSGVLTTIMLAGATLLFGSASYKPTRQRPATITVKTATKTATGLSRQRGAFDKAMNMLAEGAVANPRLAHYYKNVSKRVRGNAIKRETNSGVANVKSVNTPDSAAHNAALAAAAKGASLGVAGEIAGSESGSERDSRSYGNSSEGDAETARRYTIGDMAFDTNAAVERWMNYYSATPGGRSTMMIGLGRSHSYLEMARAEFRDAGVPEDLIWLALVESVWNPRALSPAAAGGIWQFIPSTATDYGLTVEPGNDERSDPLKQTRVAAAYLRDLHTIFGDWALAMAAYNSGEPRVMGAIVKNGRADFWDLYNKQLLPRETCDYVPKILAAIKIASQAEGYGLTPITTAESFARS